jgi:predicted nucleic acid-binding protein
MRLRVVFGTNVLVSAACLRGVPGEALESARAGEIDGVVSLHILGELRDVLMRPRFGYAKSDADLYATGIAGFCDVLVTESLPAPAGPDRDDDAVVQTALLAGAPLVVTGDAHLKGLGVPGIRFVTPAELLVMSRR